MTFPRRTAARFTSPQGHQARAVDPDLEDLLPPAPTSTPDPGRILARVPRYDGTELRVSLLLYQGDPSKPFVRVAVWQSGAADAWPLKGKGVTVKVRELAAVASALGGAVDATAGDNPSVGDDR